MQTLMEKSWSSIKKLLKVLPKVIAPTVDAMESTKTVFWWNWYKLPLKWNFKQSFTKFSWKRK